MDDLDKLAAFVESALRHADLPDNPGIESVSTVETRDSQIVLGVELTGGDLFFIEVKPA